ncbi:interleukin-12 subunit beta-like [Leptodactylus fuscus]|uniref:interleukin-12 subunit beta-like n=1 Tax=Leptodactylus fuscus TaxID=238119 RepID=UPI003F4F2677
MSLLLSFGVLVLGFHHLQSIPDSWSQHYVFVKFGKEHTLECPLQGEGISWICPHNARSICSKASTRQKTLHLPNLSHKKSGLYTCTNALHQSYSTYLLIDEGQDLLNISCTSDSYTSSVLHCSMDKPFTGPSLLRVRSYSSNMTQEGKEMKIPQDENQNFLFDIQLPNSCPSEELMDPIQMSVEVMSSHEYTSRDLTFYRRDIVVPKTPENVTFTKEKIMWSNPSWTPYPSFFPLLFELTVRYRNNTIVTKRTEEQNYSAKDVQTIRVRCRDLYNPSSWSPWSPRLNVRA